MRDCTDNAHGLSNWEEPRVSSVLAHWEHSLVGEERVAGSERIFRRSLRCRIWNTMRGTMLFVITCQSILFMSLSAVAFAVASQGILSSLIDLVFAVSIFGCNAAQFFFTRERHRAKVMLHELKEVATRIEESLRVLHPEELPGLVRSARPARKWLLGLRIYATVAMSSVTLPHLATLKPVPAMWPPLGPKMESLLALYLAANSVTCCIAYSEFLSLQLVATISGTGLYRALGRWLRLGRVEELPTIVRLHGELSAAVALQKLLFAAHLPFHLLPALGGTALATCGFIYGTFSYNFLSLVPQIFIVFIPLCLYGDTLSEYSGPGMSFAAYQSGWLDWPPRARRLLIVSMVRSMRSDAVEVKAFGYADRPACLAVLKTWFSFLQALTNLDSGHRNSHGS